jgi:hypothetical protein
MMNYNKDMELSIVISQMGLRGALSHRSYDKMVETWIDPNEPIPTYEECLTKWNGLIDSGVLKPFFDTSLWVFVRNERNRLLLESDWTQLPDSPLSSEKKTEWSSYRQELRDVTSQSDPNNIIWPVIPV